MRPGIEDLIGAGAIIHYLTGRRSPEAELAESAFIHFRNDLASCLKRCSSGKDLIGKGFINDVELASALDSSKCASVLRNGVYTQYAT